MTGWPLSSFGPKRGRAQFGDKGRMCGGFFFGDARGQGFGAGPGGGSLFFHRAQLVGAGAPAPADPTAKLEWLTLDELVAAVGGEEGEGSVGRLLRRML